MSSAISSTDQLPSAAGEAALDRLRTWPGEHRVAVGLSGGVDSSLTAALLVEAGWEVEGLTLWLMSGKGACCAEGLVDAAGICEQLGIPHHVVDTRDTFQQEIVQRLVDGYRDGITPLPCSQCNRSVKFGPMVSWARDERQLDRIATGHYARTRHGGENGRHQLLTEGQTGGGPPGEDSGRKPQPVCHLRIRFGIESRGAGFLRFSQENKPPSVERELELFRR